eukprot:2919339-Pyramimonas_sp.AAC.1
MARASAVAGHIGHAVEDHLVTDMRAFHDLNQTREFTRKLIAWLANRGGFGGSVRIPRRWQHLLITLTAGHFSRISAT